MVDKQKHDRAHHGYDYARQIQLGYAGFSKKVEEPTADDRADDPQQDIQNHPLAPVIDQVTGNETRY